jgi:hypothetical protein
LIPVNEDIEKLAHQTADKIWADDTLPDNGKSFLVNGIFAGFIEGYKAANKNYSEEDLRNSVNMGIDIWMNNMTENSAEILEKDYQKIIQFINQQKYPIAFIAELEKPSDSFGSWVGNFIGNEPKYRTITNQNLLTEMVGIYKYK